MKGNINSTIMRLVTRFSLTVLIVGVNVIFYVFVFNKISELADFSYDVSYRVFGDEAATEGKGHDVKVTILKGESTMNLAEKLVDAKVIPDKYSFFVKLQLNEYEIMPGTYILNPNMSYDEILSQISSQSNSVDEEHSVEDLESQL